MLYTYSVRKDRTWRREEYTRPFAMMKINLCAGCAYHLERIIKAECTALVTEGEK
ncbi:MAG: hypothetical protein PHS57_06190 [Alphaproteobacteria bacterium]|nr:hypothetical protein [Alphaproteobacteria bacterium]